jgi:DNA mismatch repair protein MutL
LRDLFCVVSAALPSIRSLPPDLVERIAAGEVIERPASVVRELVENSLDAGAARIDVLIEEGGVRRVRVRDDGSGIRGEELVLAIRPHATSKIASYDDLANLHTLGFRGEALASMAAVADVRIVSRVRGSPEAYALVARPGDGPRTPEPVAHPEGTTVEVRDLFYRLPARRRFLRTATTETRHVLEAVRRLAFAHPNTSFEVRDEKRLLLSVPALPKEDLRDEPIRRWLEALAGRRFAEGALRLTADSGDVRLDGWLLDPRLAGEEGEPQLWCVNGRPLRDRTLHHAVRRAYEEFLHGQRQPAYLLRVRLPPDAVDMNVHPAKQEVRFRDGGRLHAAVEQACHERLSGPRPGEAVIVPPPAPKFGEPVRRDETISCLFGADTAVGKGGKALPASAKIALRMDEALARASLESSPESPPEDAHHRFLGEPLAVLAGAFLVARAGENLVVVDVHAAHERLLFEELKTQYASGPVPRQVLLVPYPVDIGPRAAGLLAEAAPRLTRFGFEIDALGPETIVVRAVPSLLGRSDPRALLEAVAAHWDDEPDESLLAERLFAVLADRACDRALKAGEPMSLEAMADLLRRLERCEAAEHCSHGRPSYVVFGRESFERFFRCGQ